MKYNLSTFFLLFISCHCIASPYFNEFHIAVSREDSIFVEKAKSRQSDVILDNYKVSGIWFNVNPYIESDIIDSGNFVTRYKNGYLQVLVYRKDYDIYEKGDFRGFGIEEIDADGNKTIRFPLQETSYAKLEKMTGDNISKYLVRIYDDEIIKVQQITKVNQNGELVFPIKYLTSELKENYKDKLLEYKNKQMMEKYLRKFLPLLFVLAFVILIIKGKKTLYITGCICGLWGGFTYSNMNIYTPGEVGVTINIVLLDLILGVLVGLFIMRSVVKWKESHARHKINKD